VGAGVLLVLLLVVLEVLVVLGKLRFGYSDEMA
jgi:hypothetical protein